MDQNWVLTPIIRLLRTTKLGPLGLKNGLTHTHIVVEDEQYETSNHIIMLGILPMKYREYYP